MFTYPESVVLTAKTIRQRFLLCKHQLSVVMIQQDATLLTKGQIVENMVSSFLYLYPRSMTASEAFSGMCFVSTHAAWKALKATRSECVPQSEAGGVDKLKNKWHNR